MRFRIFFPHLFLFTFFLIGRLAFAEAVYLKNGSVMVGRIVERNPNFIVIKSGEGEASATATVYLEDISKIEEDEVYQQELKTVPFYLKKPQGTIEAPAPSPTTQRPPAEDTASRILALIAGDRQADADRIIHEKDTDQLPKIDGSPMTLKAYASYLQMREERHRELRAEIQARKKGLTPLLSKGRIAGVVTLPKMPQQVAVSAEASGGLYVYVLKEQADGRFTFPVPMRYAVVNASNVTLAQVRYEITGVPPGQYKVFAQWDVAPPAIREEDRSGSGIFLNYLGAEGDYSGCFKTVIKVGPDEVVQNIDFSCAEKSAFNELFFSWLQPVEYEIKDIYYSRPRLDEPHIFLVFKNLGARQIDMITLDLFIDDTKMVFPLELKNIPPGEEKEFDLSSFFVAHLKIVEGGTGPLQRKTRLVKFRIQNPITKEVEFEKAIYIF